MAKAVKTIGTIVGAVALVATGVGVFAVAGTALAATAGKVAAIATLVSGVANIGARLLTKPPPARGSITETLIEVDPPSPYLMGEGYFGGVMRHRVGYGPTLNDVPNPYLFEAVALSVAGPIEGPITPQVDFGAVPSWYDGFLDYDTKLGAVPETALTPPFDANAPGWSTNHRLSGVAQIGWGHKFDKDGERFASGVPTKGVLAKWVKVYDPRQDSTRPGGSGACRIDDESTWVWDGPPGAAVPAGENPALHAGTYSYGRHHPITGRRVFGVGLPDEGIDWEAVGAWANDCDANGWRMFGEIYEGVGTGPGQRWTNLTDICIAGGGQQLFAGGVLSFHWNRPRVALDTIVKDDLADGPQEVTAMQPWAERLNEITPRYIQPAANWSRLPGDPVSVASYLAEDGERKAEEIPFNFVKDDNQAAQLAAYWLTNSRELTPIMLTVKPRLRGYRPGEALHLDLPELGLDHDAVILRRKIDPATMKVTLILVTETPSKHPFALGLTGTAPPTPTIGQSAQQRDETAARANEPAGFGTVTITTSWTSGLTISQSAGATGTVDLILLDHTRRYSNGKSVAVTGATINLPENKYFLIYYDDPARAGGAVTYVAVNITDAADPAAATASAYPSEANPSRHFVAGVRTQDAGGAGGSSGGTSPPGGGGLTDDPDYVEP